MTSFKAPWSMTMKVFSAIISVLLVTSIVRILVEGQPLGWVVLVPLLALVGSMLFTIRGYTVGAGVMRVRRLLWDTEVSLEGLESAAHDSRAMRGSLRLFGNGGLFAATGWYYNKRLGRYRAFVTDPKRAVVLRLGSRKVVISPDDPARFVDELSRWRVDV